MRHLRNKNKGFTLIELLVVIAIIGLLASVVLLSLNSARQKSRDAKRLADVRQMASALEMFFNDKGSYPTAADWTALALQGAGLVPTYIGMLPTAPNPSDGSCGTDNTYDYAPGTIVSNLTNSYTLGFCIGAATGGYTAGSHTLSPAGIQ